MRKLTIRNLTGMELGLMLEPSTEREDAEAGASIVIEGSFVDDELIIDIGDENFVSVWSPPGATVRLVRGQET